MKSRVLIIMLLLPLTQLFAQKKMTLKECVEYGLANHRSVKVYKNDILTADQKGKEALSYYMPQVGGNVTFDDNLKRQTTVLAGAGALAGHPGQDLKLQMGQPICNWCCYTGRSDDL